MAIAGLTDVVGVLALAVVGIGTAGGNDRPLSRRFLYVLSLVVVGVAADPMTVPADDAVP